jgi:hypothetical protein
MRIHMYAPTDQQLVSQLADAIRKAAEGHTSWLSYVPVVSAAVAYVSATISLWMMRSLAREARGNKLLPVMVFYRGPELVWTLKNVGEGTALNVIVRNYISGDQVKDELELYPVAPGQQIRLDYLSGADKLIATYVNIYGRDPHYTICSRNVNGLKAGRPKEKITGSFARGHESEIAEWPVTRVS